MTDKKLLEFGVKPNDLQRKTEALRTHRNTIKKVLGYRGIDNDFKSNIGVIESIRQHIPNLTVYSELHEESLIGRIGTYVGGFKYGETVFSKDDSGRIVSKMYNNSNKEKPFNTSYFDEDGFQTEYQRGTLLAPYEEHWIRVRPINEAGKKRPGLIIKKADKSADNGESAVFLDTGAIIFYPHIISSDVKGNPQSSPIRNDLCLVSRKRNVKDIIDTARACVEINKRDIQSSFPDNHTALNYYSMLEDSLVYLDARFQNGLDDFLKNGKGQSYEFEDIFINALLSSIKKINVDKLDKDFSGESAGKSPKFTESQFDEGPEGH